MKNVTKIGFLYTARASMLLKILLGIAVGGIILLFLPHSSSLKSAATETIAPPVSDNSPTATLTINGGTDVEALRGSSVTYVWASTNANQFTGSFTRISGKPRSCYKQGDLPFNTPDGKYSFTIHPTGTECVYKIFFTAKNTNTGKESRSEAILRINPKVTF